MIPLKRVAVPTMIAGLLVLGSAALAWACTVAAHVSLRSASGPAGTSVTVIGSAFPEVPVEIRWHTTDGPVVGSAQGSNFSTEITIPPDARPGFYYLVAIAPSIASTGPSGAMKATGIFEVTAADSRLSGESRTATAASNASVAAGLWSGFRSHPSPLTQPALPTASSVARPRTVAWGLGLAGLGLAGLLSGLILATRRRVSGTSQR